MSNEKKSNTLGMSHGTACNRLRKNILFSLLTKLNENVCFRCGKTIVSVDELSIEHKQPWEGISADLFWDLDNIAFSHLGCNSAAGRRPMKKYFTEEEKLAAQRESNARYMRENYTPEKRQLKYHSTGW